MGIGRIASTTNNMSIMQVTSADLKDQKSKNIQNEITDMQQQMQKLSSEEELSVNEKANERKKLQKEISNLNTELKQHQEELLRSHKRESMMAQLQEAQEPEKEESEDTVRAEDTASDAPDEQLLPADEKQLPTEEQQPPLPGSVITQNNDGTVVFKDAIKQDRQPDVDTEKPTDTPKEKVIVEEETNPADSDTVTDAGLSGKEMQAMVSANSSVHQAGLQGTIITKTNDGIAILKGEIRQDERRDVDTERKQAELEKLEKQEQRATLFQFSILGDANKAMKASMESDAAAREEAQTAAEKNAYITAVNLSQEQTAQQRFYVSVG